MLSYAHLCNRPTARRFVRHLLLPAIAIAAFATFALAPARAQETAGAQQKGKMQPLPEILSTRAALAAPVPPPGKYVAAKFLQGHLVYPASDVLQPQDVGKKMHTNYIIFAPNTELPSTSYPPYNGYAYETPESIACLYSLVTTIPGCNPNSTVNVPAGGSQTIAIVDAYDNPTVAGDLAWFSDQMGLPLTTSQFKIVYATGSQPNVDETGGWELEAALDVEWAHAMAPSAMIYLVEANSNSDYDLYPAVSVAINLVRCGTAATCPNGSTGKGEVSMSWGGAEYSTEAQDDLYFTGANVVFLAAAGDKAGPEYPSASPNVISVGGTTTARALATGNFKEEIAWSDTGSGPSVYEPSPSYQVSLGASPRITPDVSADANPNTGVWVYSSFPQGGFYYSSNWWTVGGTSVATPIWAGVINAASTVNGSFANSTNAELTKIYGDKSAEASDFNDITYGACGPYSSWFTAGWYDWCTGVGSPKTYAGK